jgi:hypothetical protein
MGSQDDEQRVLDAIEYQLLSEDPQLWDRFSALGGLTPPVKPVNGWQRAAPCRKEARRGLRRCTGNEAFKIVIELVLVIIAIVLVVMLILGTAWMLAVLSH